MRLSLLIHKYFPYGGQQRDFLRVLVELANRGHELHVYCFSWEGNLPVDATVHKVPRRGWSRLRQYRNYSSWVAKELAKYERHCVIGFPRMPGLDVHFAADPCFAAKAEQQRSAYYRYTSRYRHFIDYERAVFGKESATTVLYLSSLQQQEFSEYYPESAGRLVPLPPGLEPEWRREQRDTQQREQTRTALAVEAEQIMLLQVGSGFRVKGIDRSLLAIASLPDSLRSRVQFFIAGDDKAAVFQRMARRLGLENQTFFLGGRSDVAELMQAADLLLHPAYSESAGYVLLEAAVSGLPVLTTASCGYALHIQNAGAGEVCPSPFEQEQLNDSLKQMLLALPHANWSQQGMAYGREQDLYSMAASAADAIENVAGAL